MIGVDAKFLLLLQCNLGGFLTVVIVSSFDGLGRKSMVVNFLSVVMLKL